jgi:hypothetical protein
MASDQNKQARKSFARLCFNDAEMLRNQLIANRPRLVKQTGQEPLSPPNPKFNWLGREDSNLRMAESKSAALPLGYAPTRREAVSSLGGKRADHSSSFSMPQWPKARFRLKKSRQPAGRTPPEYGEIGVSAANENANPLVRLGDRRRRPPGPRHRARLQSRPRRYTPLSSRPWRALRFPARGP